MLILRRIIYQLKCNFNYSTNVRDLITTCRAQFLTQPGMEMRNERKISNMRLTLGFNGAM